MPKVIIEAYKYGPGRPNFSFAHKIKSFAYPGGDVVLKCDPNGVPYQLTDEEQAELELYYGAADLEVSTITRTVPD